MEYKPPFLINDNIINLLAKASETVGQISVVYKNTINPTLRRENRIKTIHSSLAIEHNSLSVEQVTDLIGGKRVLGLPREIAEVKNAYEAYEIILLLNPQKIDDLLYAHKLMMNGLIKENGRFRSGGVGVFAGDKLIHAAPPANLVPKLVADLFEWYEKSPLHILIKSCIFHYEFEFIHPFSDGNGRMGRMWHTLLLSQWNELFAWLPIEELIRKKQSEYYAALGESDTKADCTEFVELMMGIITDALIELDNTDQVTDQATDQVKMLINCVGNDTLSAREIMTRLGLSHRDTFRKNYLNPALLSGLIEMTVPDKPNSPKQKYRKTIK